MRILFWYTARQFLRMFFLCIAGLVVLYLVVDFFENIRDFLKHDASLFRFLSYFLFRIPDIAFQLTPLAVLMSTLLSLGLMSKSHEITAMRSCGLSLVQIGAPFLVFGMVFALLGLLSTAVIVPKATNRAEYIQDVYIEKKAPPPTYKAERLWLRAGSRTLMNIRLMAPDGSRLTNVHLYQLSPDFRLQEIITAKEAQYANGNWTLTHAIRRIIRPDSRVLTKAFAHMSVDLPHDPGYFKSWLARESEKMTFHEILSYVNRLEAGGYSAAEFRTDFWGRVAFPFSSVVLGIAGLALGLRQTGGRGTGVSKGIGLAILIGFCYWTTHSVGIALGRSGALAPWLAGWVAAILFGAIAWYLVLTVRR